MSNTPATEIAYIRLPEVLRLTGLSRASVYRRMAEPGSDFPKSVSLGRGCVRWIEAEVKAWNLKKLHEARGLAC